MANIDLPEEVDGGPPASAPPASASTAASSSTSRRARGCRPRRSTCEIYRRLIEIAAPHPAIIRTYDLGGRKLAREMMATEEENPVLGLRGIRLTLARPEVFRTQIRALYRAGLYGDLWVMLPLVSTRRGGAAVPRLRRRGDGRARSARGCRSAATCGSGVMIEVPAAAMIADLLAREVDFFSIGTNDLIQYSMAVDRNNEHVASLYQPLHPAILRMLRFVIDSARAAGIEVGLCGEMAADPRFALLLVGLGLRRLSMSPRQIPEVKTWIREPSAAELAELARRVHAAYSTAAEVQRHLDELLRLLVRRGDAAASRQTSRLLRRDFRCVFPFAESRSPGATS